MDSEPSVLLSQAGYSLFRFRSQTSGSSAYYPLRIKQKTPHKSARSFTWWERVDSNHRRRSQQIYSLSPLATRELSQIRRQPLYHRCNPLSIEIFRFFQFFSKLSLRFTDFPLDGRWQTCYTVSVLEKNMLLWLSR